MSRVSSSGSSDNLNGLNSHYKSSPVWTLDFTDNLIVIGCACGRLEFWEATTGTLRTIYETDRTHRDGVTHVKISSDKVVAARLSGHIDFYRLETYTQGRHIDWNFTSAYRRTHIRTGSAGSLSSFNQQQNQRNVQRNSLNLSSLLSSSASSQNQSTASISYSPTQEELRCILELQHPGHTQPVTSLDLLGNVLFTGSQDHTLKVFHTDSNTLMYTLHGHCSPITTLLIDNFQAGTGCSGSQNGILCLWDVVTGMLKNYFHFYTSLHYISTLFIFFLFLFSSLFSYLYFILFYLSSLLLVSHDVHKSLNVNSCMHVLNVCVYIFVYQSN